MQIFTPISRAVGATPSNQTEQKKEHLLGSFKNMLRDYDSEKKNKHLQQRINNSCCLRIAHYKGLVVL